ncbi:hypothetical protein, partial [Litorivivens sp.]|uniref:hypothetical protein n=1 Tax=Litorivivens sp. TaxID=2020868 RepID=UPI0035626639
MIVKTSVRKPWLFMVGVLAPAVLAQNSKPMLEEVVVTAQKKEESLQDTPIALDAFGEEALE